MGLQNNTNIRLRTVFQFAHVIFCKIGLARVIADADAPGQQKGIEAAQLAWKWTKTYNDAASTT